MTINEQIKEWKEEAGEIPEYTCPNIDKLIKESTVLENIINRAEKKYDCDDVKALVDDLSWNMPDYSILEDLRKDNDQLRSIGKFWYKKCEELLGDIQDNYQPKTTSTDMEELRKEFEQKFPFHSKFYTGSTDGVNPPVMNVEHGSTSGLPHEIWNFFAPYLSNRSGLKEEAVREVEYQAMLRFGRFLQMYCGMAPLEDDDGDTVEFKTLAGCLVNLESEGVVFSSDEKNSTKLKDKDYV